MSSLENINAILLTLAGVNVRRPCPVVTPGAGRQTDAPLPHPIQLQVKEETRFTRQAAVEG